MFACTILRKIWILIINITVLRCWFWADLGNLKYLLPKVSIFLVKNDFLLLWIPLLWYFHFVFTYAFSVKYLLLTKTQLECHLLKKKKRYYTKPEHQSFPKCWLFLLSFLADNHLFVRCQSSSLVNSWLVRGCVK